MTNHSDIPQEPTGARGTHIVTVLDRSGSMASIADDVIGGFNTYLDGQRSNGTDARMSIVLFDSQDPQEVVVWGAPIAEITDLTDRTFQPRGGTPLLDATGLAIGRTLIEQRSRAAAGLPEEDIVFLTVTDGEENSSHEFSLEQIRTLVNERTAEGWQFVFLSAGLDAYADADRLGFHPGSSQQWRAGDGMSSRRAFESMRRATSNYRDKKREGADTHARDFFETGKDAEDDA